MKKLLLFSLFFLLVGIAGITAQSLRATNMTISNETVRFTLSGGAGTYYIKSHGVTIASGYGESGDVISGGIWGARNAENSNCHYNIECGTTGQDGVLYRDGCIVVVTGLYCNM